MPPTQTTTNTIMKKLSQVAQNNVISVNNEVDNIKHENRIEKDDDILDHNDNDYKTKKSESENNKPVTEAANMTEAIVAESNHSSTKELQSTTQLESTETSVSLIESSQPSNCLESIKTSLSVTHLEKKDKGKEKEVIEPISSTSLELNIKKRKIEIENVTTNILDISDGKEKLKKPIQAFDFTNSLNDDFNEEAIEQEMDSMVAQINVDSCTTNSQNRSIKTNESEIIQLSDNDDDDFNIPEIDMTGPDTDDEL